MFYYIPMIKCEDCLNEFKPSTAGPNPKYPGKCKKCRSKIYTQTHITNHYEEYLHKARMRHKLVTYGLTEDQYRGMYINQEGACAICNTPFPSFDERKKEVAVDHDHKTNKVRDLLCRKCNTALGMVDDDIELLLAMIAYLQKHKAAGEVH